MSGRVDLGPSWGALEQIRESVHELRAVDVDGSEIGGRRALVALDWEGHRHLLIPMADGLHIDMDRGRGVHLARRVLMEDGAAHVFLDVACLKPHLNALFDVVAGEMLAESARVAPAEIPSVCRGVVGRWRELLEQLVPGEVPLTTLAGAWGELWFARELLRRGAPWLGLWQGPTGAIHDLAGPLGDHLEVKSTTARGVLAVEIHGSQQLEAPATGRLLLGVLRLRHGPDEGESLEEMVRTCVATGADHGELLRLLGAVGINPGLAEFTSTRFSLSASWLFEVDAQFPRVVPSSFVVPLAAEITALSYQLDLTGLEGRALTGAAFDQALAKVSGSEQ